MGGGVAVCGGWRRARRRGVRVLGSVGGGRRGGDVGDFGGGAGLDVDDLEGVLQVAVAEGHVLGLVIATPQYIPIITGILHEGVRLLHYLWCRGSFDAKRLTDELAVPNQSWIRQMVLRRIPGEPK